MSKASEKASRKAESLKVLRRLLKPGSTIYTVLRHVSASGMSRRIDCFIMRKGKPYHITWDVGNVLDYHRPTGKDGLRVDGCGMDMGFHLVYNLSYALFPKGFIPAKAKPPRHGRNGTPATELDTDGGYALNQKWL